MIGTIGATVSGARKGVEAAVYFTSSICAAAAVGAALGFAGEAIPRRWAAAAGVALLSLAVGSYLFWGRMPRLAFPRQMPRRWIDTTRPLFSAARFGSVFGLHYATPIRRGSTLALGALAVAVGNPSLSIAAFAVAGALRALPASSLAFVEEIHDRSDDPFNAMLRKQALIGRLDFLICTTTLATFAALLLAHE